MRRNDQRVIALALTGLFVCLMNYSCRDNKNSAEYIEKSQELSELNRICESLPKPSGFVYLDKHLGGNSLMWYLAFDYHADVPFSAVSQFYQNYFQQAGWSLEKLRSEDSLWDRGLMKYRSGDYFIDVEHVSYPEVNYVGGCGREKR